MSQAEKEEKSTRFLKLVQYKYSQQGQHVSWQNKAVDGVVKWSDFGPHPHIRFLITDECLKGQKTLKSFSVSF